MFIQGQDSETLIQFVRAHTQANDELRLGQRFVILYIKQPWPELFYQESDKESMKIISEWLTQNHYFDKMPTPIVGDGG